MNWLTKSLDDINKDLQNLEHMKALNIKKAILKEREEAIFAVDSNLEDSIVWSLTKEEYDACELMANKLSSYRATHTVQKNVLAYLKLEYFRDRKYKKIRANIEDIDAYVSASQYWHKRNTILKRIYKNDVRWVFAINNEMKAVICKYQDQFIVCSISSHENIMREVEGKDMLHSLPWDEPQPPDAVDQILELL